MADAGKTELEIDFRTQSIPHAAVEQDVDDRIRLIRRLAHQNKNHPNKDALIAGLQSNRSYNPFSEESKQMLQNVVNVECFELCEISSKNPVFILPEVVGRRHRLLHLWDLLDSHRIHKTAD